MCVSVCVYVVLQKKIVSRVIALIAIIVVNNSSTERENAYESDKRNDRFNPLQMTINFDI